MKKEFLNGTITALATPFKADLSIDFDAFKRLLDFQLEGGIDSVVVCGSTGEAATLSSKEKVSLMITAVEHINGQIPVIAGTGSNDTKATIDMTILAKEVGAAAALVVAPYYNKPSQEGLYHHFAAIAEAVDIPQILYNVPGRAGVNVLPETQLKLAKDFANIIATKEACGDLDQMSEIIKGSPADFFLLSGDDSLAVPAILFGGKGVISVISNYAPKLFTSMIDLALEGDYDSAMSIHYNLLDLLALNFVETNPVPVKAALAIMGLMEENYRLPLLPIQAGNRKLIEKALKKAKLA